MTRAAQPFRRATALAVVIGGALVFLLLLYAMGAGWDGRRDRDGGAHAAANGLNGYSALVSLIERQGQPAALSRSTSAFRAGGLLVLTPPHGADAAELRALLAERVYYGPTLVILPKWFAAPLADRESAGARPGWVRLVAAEPPGWVEELGLAAQVEVDSGPVGRWAGMGLEGSLPRREEGQFMRGSGLTTRVAGPAGEVLAAYAYTTEDDPDLWPVTVVAEPDLLNNQGLADRNRAMLASWLIAGAQEGAAGPITFDLTLPGLGRRPNLLTLAFEPPFLAATLCLLLAALVIGWRAWHRFGAAVAGAASGVAAPGKRLLAANGAALIERAGRVHLLGAPYAMLATARIAKKLGVTERSMDRREEAIMRIARLRGHGDIDLPAGLQALREARRPAELLRAARAMRDMERTLSQ